MHPEHPYFLYAEDDRDDQQLFCDIIRSIDSRLKVVTCPQGLALMQYLEGMRKGDRLPCCIVLDMNMPLWDGLHTLGQLKKHPSFQ